MVQRGGEDGEVVFLGTVLPTDMHGREYIHGGG